MEKKDKKEVSKEAEAKAIEEATELLAKFAKIAEKQREMADFLARGIAGTVVAACSRCSEVLGILEFAKILAIKRIERETAKKELKRVLSKLKLE